MQVVRTTKPWKTTYRLWNNLRSLLVPKSKPKLRLQTVKLPLQSHCLLMTIMTIVLKIKPKSKMKTMLV